MKVEKIKEKASAYKDIGRSAKQYLKGTVVEKIADNLPEIATGAVYCSFDTFGLVKGTQILRDFVYRELIEKQSYFDFSSPQNIAISIGKMALTALSFGFLYSTIKKGNDYFRDRGD